MAIHLNWAIIILGISLKTRRGIPRYLFIIWALINMGLVQLTIANALIRHLLCLIVCDYCTPYSQVHTLYWIDSILYKHVVCENKNSITTMLIIKLGLVKDEGANCVTWKGSPTAIPFTFSVATESSAGFHWAFCVKWNRRRTPRPRTPAHALPIK
jgi:hypothetical protein